MDEVVIKLSDGKEKTLVPKTLFLCSTCQTAQWYDGDEPLSTQDIFKHKHHTFTVLTPEIRSHDKMFRDWLILILGWPLKEEADA